MTYRQALTNGVNQLELANIADAKLDAWYLLSYITGISRSDYIMCQTDEMSEELLARYNEVIERRAAHTPLQHITGEQDFMGLTFAVNEHVLIPRQDTETLVEQTLQVLQPGNKVLDLCTGSGCVIISIACNGDNINCTGIDISDDALVVARANGHALTNDAVEFLHSDLFENVEGKFDIIVSNPPYIRTDVIEELEIEVREHEPRLALDGTADGLLFYRRIVEQAPDYLVTGGHLLVEIGHDQGADVKELFMKAGFLDVAIIKDLSGNDRVVKGHL